MSNSGTPSAITRLTRGERTNFHEPETIVHEGLLSIEWIPLDWSPDDVPETPPGNSFKPPIRLAVPTRLRAQIQPGETIEVPPGFAARVTAIIDSSLQTLPLQNRSAGLFRNILIHSLFRNPRGIPAPRRWTPLDRVLYHAFDQQLKLAREQNLALHEVHSLYRLAQEASRARYYSPRDHKALTPQTDIAVHSHPADAVSGDMSTVTRDSSGATWVVIVDASGHGLSPSIYAWDALNSVLHAINRHAALPPDQATTPPMRLPARVLADADASLRHLASSGLYATACTIRIQHGPAAALQASWSLAGFPAPFALQPDGNALPLGRIAHEHSARKNPPCGFPIGTAMPLTGDSWPLYHTELHPGETLVACSDGITEHTAPDAIARVFRRHASTTAIQLCSALIQIPSHRTNLPTDDRTAAVIRLPAC